MVIVRDITKEMLVAILDDSDTEVLKVHATVTITFRNKRNWVIKNEIEAVMDTHEAVFKDGDLILTKPIVSSYNHRRYQQ